MKAIYSLILIATEVKKQFGGLFVYHRTEYLNEN